MFFFKLLFFYRLFSISLYAFLLILLSIIQSLICFLSENLKAKNIKKVVYLVTGNSLKSFYDLRSLLRLLD